MSSIFTTAVAALALFATASCSKTGPSSEAQGTPSSQTTPGAGQATDQAAGSGQGAGNGAGTGGQAMTQAGTAQGATIDIYGIPLGAPYADAVKAAGALFQLEPDGSEYHRGAGTVDGMKATLTMEGETGRLVDVQLRLALDAPDQASDQTLDGSRPLARLQAALGEPADRSADLATWKPAGFEVSLQRQRTHARGQRGAKVQYTIRGRAVPVPGGGQPDPGEQTAKEREADQGAP